MSQHARNNPDEPIVHDVFEGARPTVKSPEVDKFITEQTGIDRQATITQGKCAFANFGCKGPNFEFRTELDRKEYRISGLCQSCQDDMFGDE